MHQSQMCVTTTQNATHCAKAKRGIDMTEFDEVRRQTLKGIALVGSGAPVICRLPCGALGAMIGAVAMQLG
jgi:hypothetical protein